MMGSRMTTILIAAFLVLVAFVLLGRLNFLSTFQNANVVADPLANTSPGTLFVIVHGLDRGEGWDQITSALQTHGDVLGLRYPVFSHAAPEEIAAKLSDALQSKYDPQRHARIVIIGQSMGALFLRRAFLIAEEHSAPWSNAVT